MSKSEEFRDILYDIANKLEEVRCKIYQEEICEWEGENKNVDDRLFSLQSEIRNISEIVDFMDFKIDYIYLVKREHP